jgi:predicted nucleotidyltransferase
MTKVIDIRPHDLSAVQRILRAAGFEHDARFFVFGSRAKGTARQGSDLDIAVNLGRPLSSNERHFLANELEESDLPYRVDIVDLQTVSPIFKKMIEEDMLALAIDR